MSRYIVDDIAKVVKLMGDRYDAKPLNYMYGHRAEIANRLSVATKDPDKQYNKYPLIALRLDIAEQYRANQIFYAINVAILDRTEKGYTADKRYEHVFKPILYPLYDLFLECFRKVGRFTYPGLIPDHVKIDRPFWGVANGNVGNVANIFNDPLDAIEIVDLKFSKPLNHCTPVKNNELCN